jgi:hypothetical protein
MDYPLWINEVNSRLLDPELQEENMCVVFRHQLCMILLHAHRKQIHMFPLCFLCVWNFCLITTFGITFAAFIFFVIFFFLSNFLEHAPNFSLK